MRTPAIKSNLSARFSLWYTVNGVDGNHLQLFYLILFDRTVSKPLSKTGNSMDAWLTQADVIDIWVQVW